MLGMETDQDPCRALAIPRLERHPEGFAKKGHIAARFGELLCTKNREVRIADSRSPDLLHSKKIFPLQIFDTRVGGIVPLGRPRQPVSGELKGVPEPLVVASRFPLGRELDDTIPDLREGVRCRVPRSSGYSPT